MESTAPAGPAGIPDRPPLPREALLADAARTVSGARNVDYDEPENNFARIASHWNLYLADQLVAPVEPYQVALMMALLKVARDQHLLTRDNRLDIAGYMACAEDIAVAEAAQPAGAEPSSPAAVAHRIEVAHHAARNLTRALGDIGAGVAPSQSHRVPEARN